MGLTVRRFRRPAGSAYTPSRPECTLVRVEKDELCVEVHPSVLALKRALARDRTWKTWAEYRKTITPTPPPTRRTRTRTELPPSPRTQDLEDAARAVHDLSIGKHEVDAFVTLRSERVAAFARWLQRTSDKPLTSKTMEDVLLRGRILLRTMDAVCRCERIDWIALWRAAGFSEPVVVLGLEKVKEMTWPKAVADDETVGEIAQMGEVGLSAADLREDS